jgi:hypothetical protein
MGPREIELSISILPSALRKDRVPHLSLKGMCDHLRKVVAVAG